MPPEIKELVDEYRYGKLSRREFIHRAVALTGSLAAATSFADALIASNAFGAEVDANDPALKSGDVQFPGKSGTVLGYLSTPAAAGKYPGVIIISDNQGVVDHFRDVARRYAKAGYAALAPDVFSHLGGTAKVNPTGRASLNVREMVPKGTVTEYISAGLTYLKGLSEVRSDRVGLTGYCWGGGQAYLALTQVRGLRAAVIFYGDSPAPLDLVKNIEASVLAHYAEKDPRITGAVPATEEAMKKYNKPYAYKIYPGTQHAFFHDQRPDRYNAEAAKEAWSRTLEFFKKHLQD